VDRLPPPAELTLGLAGAAAEKLIGDFRNELPTLGTGKLLGRFFDDGFDFFRYFAQFRISCRGVSGGAGRPLPVGPESLFWCRKIQTGMGKLFSADLLAPGDPNVNKFHGLGVNLFQ
jgi:hypothetical protein